jgi:hypothetical protein
MSFHNVVIREIKSNRSLKVLTFFAECICQARLAAAKVEWHHDELFPRIGFIATNLSRPAKALVRF